MQVVQGFPKTQPTQELSGNPSNSSIPAGFDIFLIPYRQKCKFLACWAWDSSSPACRRTRRPPRPSTLKHVAPWCRIYIDLVVSQSHCIARSFETLTPWAVVPRTQLQEPVEPIWRYCCIWLWHQIKEQSCGVETRTRQEDKHLCQCRLCCILWRLWSCPRNPSHHWPRGRPRWASIFTSSNGAQSIASKSWWSRNLFHSEDSPWPSNLWAKCFSDFDFLRCRQRGEHSHGSESFCQRHRTWGSGWDVTVKTRHQGTLSRFLTFDRALRLDHCVHASHTQFTFHRSKIVNEHATQLTPNLEAMKFWISMNLSHSITTCLTFVIVTHVEIPARPSKHLTPGLQFWVSFQDLATEALEDTCNSETTSESSELNKPLQTSEFTDTFVPSPYCEGSTQALNFFLARFFHAPWFPKGKTCHPSVDLPGRVTGKLERKKPTLHGACGCT